MAIIPVTLRAGAGARELRFGGVSAAAAAAWLAAAALAELLILRTFTRVAIHIPGIDAMAGPYSALAEAGRFAYYAASVLVVVALAALAARAWRSGGVDGRLAVVSVAMAGLSAALLRLGPGLGEAAPLNTVMLAAVGIAAAAAIGSLRGRAGMAISVFAGATLLSGWYTVAQAWTVAGWEAPSSIELLRVAEILAVGAAIASPLLIERRAPGRTVVAAGAGVGLMTFVFFLGNPSTTRFLLLWSHGLTGSLPSAAYAAAAGGLAASAWGLAEGRRSLAALGILLLVLGGVGMQNTYQTALVIAGFLCFAVDGWERKAASD
jgi:hypothetical protein